VNIFLNDDSVQPTMLTEALVGYTVELRLPETRLSGEVTAVDEHGVTLRVDDGQRATVPWARIDSVIIV
jgi:hypothetical protein